jgi:RNA polymerase II subunit A C-terminal domain phosphatase
MADDFFVGIGDINSTFLPKLDASSLSPAPPPQAAKDEEVKATNGVLPNPLAKDGTTADGSETLITQDKTILVTENNAALDAQLEERPLAKKEKELQEHEEAAELEHTESPTPSASESPEPTPQNHHHHRKALLKNDDTELERVGKVSYVSYPIDPFL